MSSDEEIDECVPILWKWLLVNSKVSREFWVHPYNKRRSYDNTIKSLLNELRNYEDKFYNYTRMSPASFDFLLHLIEHKIQKQNTNFRKCVKPEEKLLVTLRYVINIHFFILRLFNDISVF